VKICKDAALKMLIKSLFPHARIIIDDRYSEHSSDVRELVREGSLIPFESLSVLEKLYTGDLKSFADMYIDTMLCTEISSLCRENGPRIKYSIAKALDEVELYSECFDPELLLGILLGDLARALVVYSGHRDYVKFKLVEVPKELLTKEFIELVESRVLNSVNYSQRYLKGETISGFLKNLEQEKSFSEVIFQVPCLDKKAIYLLLEIAKKLRESGKRVYIATSIPSKENAHFCRASLKDLVTHYLQLIEESKKYRITVCDSEVPHIGIIVNRRIQMMSSDITYREESHMTPIIDAKYVNDHATLILKHCLCSNNLVKDDIRRVQHNFTAHLL
jgi:hypothetical protein